MGVVATFRVPYPRIQAEFHRVDSDLRRPGAQIDRNFEELARVATSPSTSGAARLLTVSSTAQAFASGGAYVTFDSTAYSFGFSETVGPSVVWPLTAVGTIQVELKWGTYTGGGKVELEVDGVVPPWGLLADAGTGQEGCKRRGVHINAGAIVKVKVTQASGSDQTASVFVDFVISDPTPSASASVVVAGASGGYGDYDVTVAAPDGIAEGDLLLAFVTSREPSIVSPSGWSRQCTTAAVPGDDYAACLDTRRATAADVGGSWMWSVGGGAYANRSAQIVVLALRGATSVTAYDLSYSPQVGSSTRTITGPDDGLVVMFAGSATGGGTTTHAYPSTMGKVVERHDTNPVSGAADTASAATEAVAGSVSRTVTFSATSDAVALLVGVA